MSQILAAPIASAGPNTPLYARCYAKKRRFLARFWPKRDFPRFRQTWAGLNFAKWAVTCPKLQILLQSPRIYRFLAIPSSFLCSVSAYDVALCHFRCDEGLTHSRCDFCNLGTFEPNSGRANRFRWPKYPSIREMLCKKTPVFGEILAKTRFSSFSSDHSG